MLSFAIELFLGASGFLLYNGVQKLRQKSKFTGFRRSMKVYGIPVNRNLRPDMCANTGEPILIQIMKSESLRSEIVQFLLQNGFDPSIRSLDGTPAIIVALKYKGIGRADQRCLIEHLIAGGADVNAMDKEGNTALFYAYDVDIADLLISAGALINARNAMGLTPVFAVESEQVQSGLITRGAELDIVDSEYRNLLLFAKNMNILRQICCAAPELVNMRNNKGQTAIFCYAGSLEWLKVLVLNGADVQIADNDGKTVLFMVKDIKCARVVFEKFPYSSDIVSFLNMRDNTGKTALFYVDEPALARYLVSGGLDPNIADNDGKTAPIAGLLAEAEDLRRSPDSEDANEKRDSVHEAVSAGVENPGVRRLELLQQMVSMNGSLRSSDIHHAAKTGDLFMLERCLQNGSDANALDDEGKSLLYHAISLKSAQIVELLCRSGADCRREVDGMTPTELALKRRSPSCLQVLIHYGAPVTNENLVSAIKCHSPECLEVLLKSGIKPGRDLLDLMDACCVGTTEYLAMLRLIKPYLDDQQ